AGTDTLEEAALHRLVLRARETPGTISVFEGPDEAVAVQSIAAPKTETEGLDSGSKEGPRVHHAQDAPTETDHVTAVSDEPILRPQVETPPLERPAESEPLTVATAAEESFAVASDQVF